MSSKLKNLVSPAWAILEYGAYPFLLLASTPWFLYRLGVEEYGHWMLLAATVSVGGIMNIGTGASTIKAVSAGRGGNIDGQSDRAVNASLAIALLAGGTLAVIVFAVFWFGSSLFLSRMGDPMLVQATGTAAAILIWIEQLDNVFSSAMKGAEHFSRAARVEILSKLGQIIVAAIVLFTFPTLHALYVTLVFAGIIRLIAKMIIARHLLELGPLKPTLRKSTDIVSFAKWGWLQGIGSVLFGVVDRMLIGSMLGATSLSFYAIASQLAMQAHAVTAAGLSVIFPKVSRKLESGGTFSIRRFFGITTAGNLLLSTLISIALILIGPWFLRIWVGPATAEPTSQLLPWLVIAYWLLSLNSVSYYLLLGMGRIRFISLTVIASGVFAVIAAWFAIDMYGLMAASAGRTAYAIVSLLLLAPIAKALWLNYAPASSIPEVRAVPDKENLQ